MRKKCEENARNLNTQIIRKNTPLLLGKYATFSLFGFSHFLAFFALAPKSFEFHPLNHKKKQFRIGGTQSHIICHQQVGATCAFFNCHVYCKCRFFTGTLEDAFCMHQEHPTYDCPVNSVQPPPFEHRSISLDLVHEVSEGEERCLHLHVWHPGRQAS